MSYEINEKLKSSKSFKNKTITEKLNSLLFSKSWETKFTDAELFDEKIDVLVSILGDLEMNPSSYDIKFLSEIFYYAESPDTIKKNFEIYSNQAAAEKTKGNELRYKLRYDKEWEKFYTDKNKKATVRLEDYIDKYGEEEGRTKYKDYCQKKTNHSGRFTSERKKAMKPSYIPPESRQTRIEYYLSRGYSYEESKLLLSQRQSTRGELNMDNLERSRYRNDIMRLSNENAKILLDNEKRNLYDYHLDHIFSVNDGWLNNVPVHIISHISNLRIISATNNRIKYQKSDITLEELYRRTCG